MHQSYKAVNRRWSSYSNVTKPKLMHSRKMAEVSEGDFIGIQQKVGVCEYQIKSVGVNRWNPCVYPADHEAYP